MKKTIEICCFNIQSAINAYNAGAHRIELCDNYFDGGTTPSYGVIEYVRKCIDIDLFVMIRPRGGNFIYSEQEIEVMRSDIRIAKELKADGVVFGLLNSESNLDLVNTKVLVDEAFPLPVTFHRAFDNVSDPFHTLELLISLGVKRILTSGQKQNACVGKELIRDLIRKAGDRISIMPGSGLTTQNIIEISEYTAAREFHFSAKSFIDSKDDPLGISGKHIIADENIIQEMIRLVSEH